MFEWIAEAAVATVTRYGWVALFVFVVLETAWILHFAPSEVVVPVAALVFVSGPASLVAFLAVLTVGSVLGSLVCYWLFGVNADRALSRYESSLPTGELDRGRAWFERYGRGVVLWGRLVPVLRTPLSIPAGATRMDIRMFTVYSALGWSLYWVPISLLGYAGETGRAPIEIAADAALAFGRTHPVPAGAVAVAVGLAFAAGIAKVHRDARGAGRTAD